jgi:hypothetical protein
MSLALTHVPTPATADTLPALPSVIGPPRRAESPGGVPLDQAPPARARSPVVVRDWFDSAAEAAIPDYDGSIGTARSAAQAYARRAKAANTRRAYRAGVRAWCDWCDQHALPLSEAPCVKLFSSWCDPLCLASLRLNGLVASPGWPRLESYELNRITLSPVRSDGTVTIISRSAR